MADSLNEDFEPFNAVEKFQAFVKKLDSERITPEERKRIAEEQEARAEKEAKEEKLYDVWKLSLPTGHVKKLVMTRVPEMMAINFTKNLSRTRAENMKGSDTKVIVFYEKFPAGTAEPDIFYNPGPLTNEAKSDKIVITNNSEEEIDWHG